MKRNKIDSLKDDRDVKITDKTELKRMATSYFKNLYLDEGHVIANDYPIKGEFPRLETIRMDSIDADITSE